MSEAESSSLNKKYLFTTVHCKFQVENSSKLEKKNQRVQNENVATPKNTKKKKYPG